MASVFGRPPEEVSARSLAVRRLADACRAIVDELVTTTADIAAVEEVAAMVEQAAAGLGALAHGRGYSEAAETSLTGSTPKAEATGFLEFSPLVGRSNALAPPLEIEVEGQTVIATAVFGPAYEGPPGHVHGGFVAAAFDEVLGMAQAATGHPGMTGRLTVHYRSPTPLGRPVRFVASLDRVEGRKIFTTGAVYDGERLCAEAEGLFVSIDASKFAALTAQRTL